MKKTGRRIVGSVQGSTHLREGGGGSVLQTPLQTACQSREEPEGHISEKSRGEHLTSTLRPIRTPNKRDTKRKTIAPGPRLRGPGTEEWNGGEKCSRRKKEMERSESTKETCPSSVHESSKRPSEKRAKSVREKNG